MKDCSSVALIKTSLGTRCKTYVSGLVLTAEIIINVLLTWTGEKNEVSLAICLHRKHVRHRQTQHMTSFHE